MLQVVPGFVGEGGLVASFTSSLQYTPINTYLIVLR
jgi:hypothetical protein